MPQPRVHRLAVQFSLTHTHSDQINYFPGKTSPESQMWVNSIWIWISEQVEGRGNNNWIERSQLYELIEHNCGFWYNTQRPSGYGFSYEQQQVPIQASSPCLSTKQWGETPVGVCSLFKIELPMRKASNVNVSYKLLKVDWMSDSDPPRRSLQIVSIDFNWPYALHCLPLN